MIPASGQARRFRISRHRTRRVAFLDALRGDTSRLRILASPFSRTLETAECVVKALSSSGNRRLEIELRPELRERHFGRYELASHDNYHEVWSEDARSPEYRPGGEGESVRDVAARLEGMLREVEAEDKRKDILVVAHGDTLSILWALVSAKPFEKHRDVALRTGELRRLR